MADFDKPYEPNEVGMRQIVYFSIGLFLLIVVTFGLMWALQIVMEDDKKAADDKNRNPLALTKEEKLPPEPRVQAAPGFGIDGPNGRINLELKPPQSEYWELQKIWQKQTEEGQKVVKDGKETIVTLPVKDAKEAILKENLKARSGESAEKALEEARTFVSGASAGRTRTERIR
ncbi:MAG: hypothetical protein IPJ30_01465 [Acidobacteria bacterium]|nr:hypothetical protein [Acidobacteriota bacterium]